MDDWVPIEAKAAVLLALWLRSLLELKHWCPRCEQEIPERLQYGHFSPGCRVSLGLTHNARCGQLCLPGYDTWQGDVGPPHTSIGDCEKCRAATRR